MIQDDPRLHDGIPNNFRNAMLAEKKAKEDKRNTLKAKELAVPEQPSDVQPDPVTIESSIMVNSTNSTNSTEPVEPLPTDINSTTAIPENNQFYSNEKFVSATNDTNDHSILILSIIGVVAILVFSLTIWIIKRRQRHRKTFLNSYQSTMCSTSDYSIFRSQYAAKYPSLSPFKSFL